MHVNTETLIITRARFYLWLVFPQTYNELSVNLKKLSSTKQLVNCLTNNIVDLSLCRFFTICQFTLTQTGWPWTVQSVSVWLHDTRDFCSAANISDVTCSCFHFYEQQQDIDFHKHPMEIVNLQSLETFEIRSVITFMHLSLLHLWHEMYWSA